MNDPLLANEIIRNGVVIEVKKLEGAPVTVDTGSKIHLSISCDVMLQTNDQVILKIYQTNFYGEPASSNNTTGEYNFFQGHLVFAN
ncbi:MAG: hypothetical protein JNM00_01690 [Flavobacteriales bacterium]|nr:hypothetical protein [Flavobacteriales bacterium]